MSKAIKSVGSALGFGGEDAVKDAGQAQAQGVREQIDYLRGAESRARQDLAPFRQLGTRNIDAVQSFLDPQAQVNYLSENPIFNRAVDYTSDQLKTAAAARGKAGSGGLVNQLFNNYLSQGQNFINNRFNQLLTPVQLGQSSAAGSAANTLSSGAQIGNAFSNLGDIDGASILGQQNARGQLGSNLLKIGGTALAFSDRNLKTDIKPVGEDEEGNVLYEFSYKSPERYIGYMAQDISKKDPQNVLLDDSGYLMVTEKYAPKRVA